MSYKKFLTLAFSILFLFIFSSLSSAPISGAATYDNPQKEEGEAVNWFKEIPQRIEKWWQEGILPRIENLEEKRIPVIKEEFKKEKEEMKDDLKNLFSAVFNFFKELIK